MRYAWQWLKSAVFVAQMYVAIVVIMLAYTPLALVDQRASLRWMQLYGRWVRFTARVMVGLKTEVRGTPPEGACLIASKHQSMLDSVILVSVLPTPRFIMKKQLGWIPLAGWHGLRAGFVPVDRGKRGSAIKKMLVDVKGGNNLLYLPLDKVMQLSAQAEPAAAVAAPAPAAVSNGSPANAGAAASRSRESDRSRDRDVR